MSQFHSSNRPCCPFSKDNAYSWNRLWFPLKRDNFTPQTRRQCSLGTTLFMVYHDVPRARHYLLLKNKQSVSLARRPIFLRERETDRETQRERETTPSLQDILFLQSDHAHSTDASSSLPQYNLFVLALGSIGRLEMDATFPPPPTIPTSEHPRPDYATALEARQYSFSAACVEYIARADVIPLSLRVTLFDSSR